MRALWRLYRAAYGPGLDGAGGLFASGRWHSQGERVVYFGGSAAIAVLERLAHTNPELLPDDLRLARFEIDAEPQIVTLSGNWTKRQDATQATGSQWIQEGASCLLQVPSAILPEESNLVLNPRHRDAPLLKLVSERPFRFDSRLI